MSYPVRLKFAHGAQIHTKTAFKQRPSSVQMYSYFLSYFSTSLEAGSETGSIWNHVGVLKQYDQFVKHMLLCRLDLGSSSVELVSS